MTASILIIADDKPARDPLQAAFEMSGYTVVVAESGEEGVELVHRERFDVIVTDIELPGITGLEVLRRARAIDPSAIVVLVTGHATVETAVEALRRGATDYVVKPFAVSDFEQRLRGLLHRRVRAADDAGSPAGGAMVVQGLIGASRAMAAVRAQIAKAAATSSTVLITGESGTGKELAARQIHDASKRRLRRFVAVNCSAIPESLFESHLFGHVKGAFTSAVTASPGLFAVADRGTLFLDEVAELPPHLQVKLLRVIEEKQILAVGATRAVRVDVRIIAATNRDLRSDVTGGRFREDLYYRLNVVRISLPPLREHLEDVPLLVEHMIEKYNAQLDRHFERIDPAALESLMAHDWRGNVRELEHVIERAMTSGEGPVISRGMLPDELFLRPASVPLRAATRQFERQKINEALARVGFDKRAAARVLGLSLASLYRKLDEEPIS